VTRVDVENAITELEAAGQPICCRTVLNRIGGSKRDVARYLREIRGTTPEPAAAPVHAVPAPEPGLHRSPGAPWKGRVGLPPGVDIRPSTKSEPAPDPGPRMPWQRPYVAPDPERPDYSRPLASSNGVHGDPAEQLAQAETNLARLDGLFRDACDHLVHVKVTLLATKDLPIAGINHGSLHPHDERHQEAMDDVAEAKRQYDALWQQRDAARQRLKDARTAYRRFQQEQWVADHAPQLLEQRDHWKHRADHPTSGHDAAEAKKNHGMAQQAYAYAVAQAPADGQQ